MANYSDHKKPFTNINKLLPEVYRSNVNGSAFDMAFNRHLTKDDTARVAGFIGTGNPQALVNRQIQETTPHRQAFQLAPTMFTQVGTVEHALSFKAFQGQLDLMGVDINRIQKWGNTLQFNWAPPINLDLLINYQDYFWKPDNAKDAPQYFTIENRCNKAQSRVQAYANTLAIRGSSFNIDLILYATDQFVITGKLDDLFVAGFEFYTDGTANPNLLNKHWTVAESTYDDVTDKTTISVVESVANAGATPPVGPSVGLWWYDTTVPTLKEWNGSAWVLAVQSITVNLDLTRLLTDYQIDANCACAGSFGWDSGPWDQDSNAQWDASDDCDVQVLNQWSAQNRWIHKSQVQSFSDVKRAQVPIIEYNSTIELNEWTKYSHVWKYRENVDDAFTTLASVRPKRFELEPVKGYIVANVSGKWVVYLFDQAATVNREIDYTDTFVPGYKFRFTDDTLSSLVYTVESSEYRQVGASDPAPVTAVTGLGYFVTIVTLAETVFTAAPQGGGLTHIRLEPLLTARGDTWRGYHVHWLLDTTQTVASADTTHSWNYYLATELASPPAPILVSSIPVHADDSLPFIPAVSTIVIGKAFEELVIDIAGVTRIDLVDSLRYSATTPTFFGTPNSNEVRVYVDGIRQYANYTEVTALGTPSYTLVGQTAQTTQQIPYVRAVVFDEPLDQFVTVRIEVGPAAQSELGYTAVPVRTIEDEVAFTLATVAGVEPAYVPFTQYLKQEQTKRQVNQYPLFNVYDVVTSEVVKGSQLFGFKEASDQTVNPAVGRRIVAAADGKEYTFEQFLLDRDDNILYGYRNVFNMPEYWYSPLLNTVKFWDGRAFTSEIVVTLAGNIHAKRVPVISKLEPAELLTVDHSFWMDTTTNTLKQRIGGAWVVVVGLVINGTDPSLQTVWKHGLTNQQYVPAYVDKDRNPTTIGSPAGDWEVVDQWFYNSEHHNKQDIKFSEVITHFRTVLEQQPKLPGLIAGGVFTRTQNEIDFGLGGTIKEHNDGFDTLISAVNVTNVTPLGVIEFAQQEYAAQLLSIRDLFNKHVSEIFGVYDQASLLDFDRHVSDFVINRFESNDFAGQIYGDTVAFNPATGKGIRNWIATIPMFGLGEVFRPHLTVQDGDVRLFHHDGHRSTIQYSSIDADKLIRIICATPDPRAGNGKYGMVSSAVRPINATALATAFGSLRPSVYWYRISGGVRTFSHFRPYAIGGVAPSFLDGDGNEIPDGLRYYDTTTDATYQKMGLSWVAITTLGAGDITPLWVDIDLAEVVGNLHLEVETRLYDVTPELVAAFDYGSLTPDANEQAAYDALLRTRFNDFIVANGISTPFVNNDYNPSDAFSWNYVSSTSLIPPRLDISPASASSWEELYTRWYGTPYPHLEPWKLQGFHDKPTWWDGQYLNLGTGRRWIYTHSTTTGMWQNIRTGQVPAGQTYPDGSISTGNSIADGQTLPVYNYLSVNISDGSIPGGYLPDELLPPYYDNAATAGPLPTVRSLFNAYTSEISAPDADYAFGDGGPTEWLWSVSRQHPYDFPSIAFLMQPARFLHYAFGPQYTLVDQLQVETTFHQVYSHEDVLFHGDVFNTDQTYSVRGLNQWYVNYNRFSGIDTNGEFRELWAGWDPRLTYQFAGIVDTSTFEIANKYFDIIGPDYQILLVNNGVIKDMWVDAFVAGLLNIPPSLVSYNNQSQWKIVLDSLASITRDIHYYGVKSYQVTVNQGTDRFTAFSYPIVGVSGGSRRFNIVGDHTAEFPGGATVTVTGSTFNNGTYTVTSSVFETSANRTRVNVQEAIPASSADGFLNVSRTIPWQTGDAVVIGSSKFLPAPLQPNTQYFVIRINGKEFQFAETANDALLGNAIDITSAGEGILHVSQVDTSFYVFGGNGNTQDLWFHYTVDKTDVRTLTPPYTIVGMQTLIDVMDGYAAYQADQGQLQNVADSNDFDPDTGRLINWALETERFIDWAYGLRQSRIVVADRFPVTANVLNDTLTFGNAVPQWTSGTPVVITSSGDVPAPLNAGNVYYVITTSTEGVIQLSTSANASDLASIVDLTTIGSGQVMLALFTRNNTFPEFELNPSRNTMWIDTPLGVLSNVITGPYSDIRVQQTIFDQYSRPVGPDSLTVYRQDQRSRIGIRTAIPNDVDIGSLDDPYNYIHLGGAHLFIEGYEHFLVFNDYTVDGSLIYDSFLGLYATKFDVDYFEKQDYTLRPTLGGYYLLDQQFSRNMEGSASDFRNYYDAMELSETSSVARRSCALLGYRGRSEFLDLLNVNSKSQFLFYRGMVQTKGSVNSVKAYINSRHFIDAKMDEFWAWKIAEFGDSRPRVYPEIKMFSTDGALDDVRLEFLAPSDIETDPEFIEVQNKGFQLVSFKDDTRWNNFPEQTSIIKTALFLDTTVSALTLYSAGVAPPPPGAETTINFWFDTNLQKLYKFNSATARWDIDVTAQNILIEPVTVSPLPTTDYVYLRVPTCDDVRVIHRELTTTSTLVASATAGVNGTFTVAGDRTSDITVGVPFAISGSTSNDGYYYPTDVDFTGANTVITVANVPSAAGAMGTLFVQNFGQYTTEIYGPGSGVKEVTKVDSEVVRFNLLGFNDVIMLFTLVPAKEKLSPAKLIDLKAGTVVQQIPMWDPARGHHSHVAIHNVDLQHTGDPARYEFTPNPADATENFWNHAEVGTRWLDTAELGYLQYFDDQIYSDINERLYNWGRLAPWASIRVFEWIRSTVPPEGWDALVVAQQKDTTIAQQDKATGTPRKAVFKRVRESIPVASISTSLNTVRTSNTLFTPVDGDRLLVVATTMPAGLASSVKYIIGNVQVNVPSAGLTSFTLTHPDTEQVVDITSVGSGVTVVPAFTASDWNTQSFLRDRTHAPFLADDVRDMAGVVTPITWPYSLPLVTGQARVVWTPQNPAAWVLSGAGADSVNVYINGELLEGNLSVVDNLDGRFYAVLTDAPLVLNEYDIIDIVRPIHTPSTNEQEFDPDTEDDGLTLIQWKADFQYSTNTVAINGGVNDVPYYYFWVEKSTNHNPSDSSNLSLLEIERQLETIPTPYFVVQKPKDDPTLLGKYGYGVIEYGSIFSLGVLTEADYQIPVQYREVIIRKIASYLGDDDRYIVRFTRDWALRDDIRANGKQMNLKDKHEEWFMFRREQTNTLPRELWDRLTECMAGRKLNDATVRVPSLERELYDSLFGSDTRFGLADDQAFADKTLATGTVLAYLTNPMNDFTPTDVDAFFANQSFDTPEGIIQAMDVIYTTFNATHVNAIWFEALLDAFSTRAKYKELMKTSWIALHGIRVLGVGGLFDD